MRNKTCRICGLAQARAPWGEDGKTPTFEICDCCGVEFGYEDATSKGVREYRKRWLDHGAEWWEPTRRPENWDLSEQLRQVPGDFL